MRKRLIILFLAGVLAAVSGCSQFAADATKTIEAESSTLQAEAAEKKAAEKVEEKAAEATAAEAAEAAADAEGELPVPNADHLNLLPGRWMDAVSQRAGMTICELDEEYQYYVEVFWGGSALEYSVWSMNAVYDPETDTITAEGFFDPDAPFTVVFSYDDDRSVVWTENGESTVMEYSMRTD